MCFQPQKENQCGWRGPKERRVRWVSHQAGAAGSGHISRAFLIMGMSLDLKLRVTEATRTILAEELDLKRETGKGMCGDMARESFINK